MPSQYIPNQPVSFGDDINIFPPNGCSTGPTYYAPVNRGDLTTFLLPNVCPEIWGSELIANGTFAVSLAGWSQGTGNGAVNEWVQSGGKAVGEPTSRILNQPVTITGDQKYKLSIDITLGGGCTIYVVGYRSYVGDTSEDYEIIATITTTGTNVLTFVADEDYVRIGFILEGDCEESDLDNISLVLATYDCVEICIKDLEGDIIDTVTDIDYYGDFIAVTVDWAALGTPDGCYYICICNPEDVFFGDNLFTYADNGSFEDNDDGISSDATDPARSTDQAYTGVYSYFTGMPAGAVPVTLLETTSDITLKRNTQYRLSGWVYIDSSIAVSDAAIGWTAPSSTGFTGAVTDDSNSLLVQSAANQQIWKELYIEFTTGDDIQGHFELTFTASAWADNADIWIDHIILYEVGAYETCSQGFNLKDDHGGTLLLQYTNDNPAFGFIYPTDFYFYMRIPAGLQHPRYPEKLKTFEDTTGTDSVAYAKSEKVEVLAANPVPEYTHDALRIAVLHDTLLIDGIAYVKIPGEYRPVWDKASYIAPVEMEVRKAVQNTENAKC